MGLASLHADIIERRAQNAARIIFEDQYPQGDAKRHPQGDSQLRAMAQAVGMTPTELIDFRKWVQRITKECDERLSREMALVYTLNEQRTRVMAVQYMPKGEAAEMAKIVPAGELLDLDGMYRGMLVRGRYVFVSEHVVAEGLRKYEPADLLNGLIEERRAA